MGPARLKKNPYGKDSSRNTKNKKLSYLKAKFI